MLKLRLALLIAVIALVGSISTAKAQSTFGGCNGGLADLINCTLHYTAPPNPAVNLPWGMGLNTCNIMNVPGAPYALTSVTIDGVVYPVPFSGFIAPYGKVTIWASGMSIVP